MIQQRSLSGQLPDPDIVVLPTGQQQTALTGQVHPCDPPVVGGHLAEDVAPGQTEQANVAATVGRYQDPVLVLVPDSQGGDSVA